MSKFIAGTTPVVCYTKIPNSLIRDKEISEGAFRLICWVSSHTPDFEFSFESIKEALGYGREKLRGIIKESEAANYLVRRRLRLDNGSFDWEYHIFLDPDDAIAYKKTIGDKPAYGENHSHQGGQTRRVVEPPVAEPVYGSDPPYIKEQCEKNKLKKQQQEEYPLTPKGDDELIPELKILEAEEENASTLTLSLNKTEPIASTQIIVLDGNVPPSAKKPKQDAEFFEPLRAIYNQVKPTTWAECKSLNDKRFRAFKRLYQELGDRTAQTMQEALCFVQHDRWWRETYSSRCIDGLLVSGRVQQLSDSYKAINPTGQYNATTGEIGVIDPDTGDRITDPNHIAILKGLGRI